MDYRHLFKKEKLLSSLELDKQDVTYQVWELGRIYAELKNSFLRIKWNEKDTRAAGIPNNLTDEVQFALENFTYLSNRLRQFEITVIGDTDDLNNLIIGFLRKSKQQKEVDGILDTLETWNRRLRNQIRAKSIHLSNIFRCSYGLKTLQTKLIYDIFSEDIGDMLRSTINDIEKLEKGDKVLVSSNLQLSPLNLKIARYRVGGVQKNLEHIRELVREDPDFFKKRMNERSAIIESLILDIRNPPDYLSRFRKIYNNVIPFLISYYLVVVPIVMVSGMESWPALSENKTFMAVLAGFVPIYLSFIVWTFRSVRNRLIVSSFRFKKSDFK